MRHFFVHERPILSDLVLSLHSTFFVTNVGMISIHCFLLQSIIRTRIGFLSATWYFIQILCRRCIFQAEKRHFFLWNREQFCKSGLLLKMQILMLISSDETKISAEMSEFMSARENSNCFVRFVAFLLFSPIFIHFLPFNLFALSFVFHNTLYRKITSSPFGQGYSHDKWSSWYF